LKAEQINDEAAERFFFLNRDRYFYCEKLKARMPMKDCRRRYRKGNKRVTHYRPNSGAWLIPRKDFIEFGLCRACEIGRDRVNA